MNDTTLEEIILSGDRRNMRLLQPHLPPDYCLRAARLAFENRARVIIVTGFYLTDFGAAETDGPPGAIAIGRALAALRSSVTYVTDCYTTDLLAPYVRDHARLVSFPIDSLAQSHLFTAGLLAEIQPTLLVTIERCGVTSDGTYRNARGMDISSYTAKLDSLFVPGLPSIGIGDGGNEIGMGNLAKIIPTISGLPAQPAVTCVSDLIAASVSNWGGYALVAGLSMLAGRDLLPNEEDESCLIQALFRAGCYDGTCSTPVCGVDGFSLDENAAILARLRGWLEARNEP